MLEYATIVTSGDLIQPEHLRLQQSSSSQEEPASDRIAINLSFTPEEFSLDAVNRYVVE